MAANIIHTDEAKKKIKDKLQEISYSKTRASGERDLQKNIIGDLAEEFQLDKKMVRKMATAFHNESFKKNVEEQREFEIVYETVTGEKADVESDGSQEVDINDE